METDDREIAADREQDNARTVPSEIGIKLERARQNLGPQERSRAVADDNDFLGVAAACDVGEVLRKSVDALVPFRAAAVREFPGPDRVGQQIEQIGLVFRIFQHGAECGDEHGRGRGDTEPAGNAERFQACREAERNAQRQPALH